MLLEETQSKSFRITVPWKKAEGDIRNFICKRFSSTVCNDIKAFYTNLKVQYVSDVPRLDVLSTASLCPAFLLWTYVTCLLWL